MDDLEIVRLLCCHDERGMEALLRKYGGLIRYVVRGIVEDAHDAEECVSDVLLAMWQKAAGYSPERGSLKAYITAASRNAAISRSKAGKKRSVLEAELTDDCSEASETPESELLRREKAEKLKTAFGRLSGQERELFYRKYYYMQSMSRIAAEMGLSERAAEGRLYRIRKRLQTELGGDGL